MGDNTSNETFGCITKPLEWNRAEFETFCEQYKQYLPTSESIQQIKKPKPFEIVDCSQYKPQANCTTFSTSCDRWLYWIYAFNLRFYEGLGTNDLYTITWKDPSNNARESKITVTTENKVEGEKLITITMFFNTLNIMIQGAKMTEFVNGEFKPMLSTVNSMCAHTDEGQSPATEPSNNTYDTDVKSAHSEHDTADTSSPMTSSDIILPTQTGANSHTAQKPQIPQTDNKALDKIARCLEFMSQVMKGVSTTTEGMSEKIISLQEQNTALQLQVATTELSKEKAKVHKLEADLRLIKNKPNEAGMLKEHEALKQKLQKVTAESLVCEESAKINIQTLEKTVATLNKRIATLENDLQRSHDRSSQKDALIETLELKVNKLQNDLIQSHDSAIAMKLQLQEENGQLFSQVTSRNPEKKPDPVKHSDPTPDKAPDIFLIGTSIASGVDPNRLVGGFNTQAERTYHTQDALRFVSELNCTQPQAILFQLMTNDIKEQNQPAQKCADDLVQLVEKTKLKFPKSGVIISLPPGRGEKSLHIKTQEANVAVKRQLLDSDVAIIDNQNLLLKDQPNPDLFRDDLIHLNKKGNSQLAANMREF